MFDRAKVRRDDAEWREHIQHQTNIRQENGQNWIHGDLEHELLPSERRDIGGSVSVIDAIENCPVAEAE